MELSEQRTMIGVPYYDGEEPGVLAACLKNLDHCLNKLNIDAKIVIGINGPRVSMGKTPLSYDINRSKFNADVDFIKTPPGLVAAEKTICRQAVTDGFKRIFLTDADISRLPLSLYHLWHLGDKPIIGTNYCAYPPEILIDSGMRFSPYEIALMKIFEADKHPKAREFTFKYRPQGRLKGSLLLVNPQLVSTMFGYQEIMSDSRMNRLVPDSEKQVVQIAAFMHYPRTNLQDYIQARIRHFRAAASEKDLDNHTKQEAIYSRNIAENISEQILKANPDNQDVLSNFLLQCALRYEVSKICRSLISGKKHLLKPSNPKNYGFPTNVSTLAEAIKVINNLLIDVDLDSIDPEVSNGRAVTQDNLPRIPLDLEGFLASNYYKEIMLSHLGLDLNTEV